MMGTTARRRREKKARREDILQAARTVFSANGFDGTSISQIAEEAELAVGTLYNFFENKEELYNKVIVQEQLRIHAALREAIAGADSPLQKLRAYITRAMQYLKENFELAQLYLQTTPETWISMEAGLDAEGRGHSLDFRGEMVEICRQGVDAGELAPLPPGHIYLLVDGLINAAVWQAVQSGGTSTVEQLTGSVLAVFTSGVVAKDHNTTG